MCLDQVRTEAKIGPEMEQTDQAGERWSDHARQPCKLIKRVYYRLKLQWMSQRRENAKFILMQGINAKSWGFTPGIGVEAVL